MNNPIEKKWHEHKEIWAMAFFFLTFFFSDFWKDTKESLSPEEVRNQALLTQIQITVEHNAKEIQKLNEKDDKRYTSEDAKEYAKYQQKLWQRNEDNLQEIYTELDKRKENFMSEHEDFKRDTEREIKQIKSQISKLN